MLYWLVHGDNTVIYTCVAFINHILSNITQPPDQGGQATITQPLKNMPPKMASQTLTLHNFIYFTGPQFHISDHVEFIENLKHFDDIVNNIWSQKLAI